MNEGIGRYVKRWLKFSIAHPCRYGWIRITFFDEASDFVQEIQEEFSSISKTNQTFHTMEIPEDVSLDEPFNNTLIEKISMLTRNHVDDWDQHLDWAMYQYRTDKHPVMGYTPFQLLYSRCDFTWATLFAIALGPVKLLSQFNFVISSL